jgi:hypothetical protein
LAVAEADRTFQAKAAFRITESIERAGVISAEPVEFLVDELRRLVLSEDCEATEQQEGPVLNHGGIF